MHRLPWPFWTRCLSLSHLVRDPMPRTRFLIGVGVFPFCISVAVRLPNLRIEEEIKRQNTKTGNLKSEAKCAAKH